MVEIQPIYGDLLVGGFNHLEKYESQWEGWHPIYEMENNPFLFETNQFIVSYTIVIIVMFTNLANHSQSWVVYDIVLPPGKLT